MFYCDECGRKKGWPIGMLKSKGPCEICHQEAICNEVPSGQLPYPKDMALPQVEEDDLQPLDDFGDICICGHIRGDHATTGECEECSCNDFTEKEVEAEELFCICGHSKKDHDAHAGTPSLVCRHCICEGFTDRISKPVEKIQYNARRKTPQLRGESEVETVIESVGALSKYLLSESGIDSNTPILTAVSPRGERFGMKVVHRTIPNPDKKLGPIEMIVFFPPDKGETSGDLKARVRK